MRRKRTFQVESYENIEFDEAVLMYLKGIWGQQKQQTKLLEKLIEKVNGMRNEYL